MIKVSWIGCALAVAGLAACGPRSGDDNNNGGSGDDGGGGSDAHIWWDGTPGDGGQDCEPPDMLIVLDRTMSMHRQPNGDPAPQNAHELSKWYLAVVAIEAVTAGYDQRLRFGLELFPRDPGGGACVTLTQRIDGTTATNERCETGEVPVLPALGTGSDIAEAIDPETTRLCTSTPIGAGLDLAVTTLAGLQDPIREQYVFLVTDGGDTCTTPDPLERVQALWSDGVSTYAVGFDATGTGVNVSLLNNMACAGHTAPDFSQNCHLVGGGYEAVDPANGPTLYLSASDGAELENQLETVASDVGCIVQ